MFRHSSTCQLTYNKNRGGAGVDALRESVGEDNPVGGESVVRDHVCGATEELCCNEDKTAQQQDGLHLLLEQEAPRKRGTGQFLNHFPGRNENIPYLVL